MRELQMLPPGTSRKPYGTPTVHLNDIFGVLSCQRNMSDSCSCGTFAVRCGTFRKVAEHPRKEHLFQMHISAVFKISLSETREGV